MTVNLNIVETYVNVFAVWFRLSQSNVWWMDGTFGAKPVIFEQLYTIHVKSSNEFMPAVWCLLPNKQMQTYTRLFQLMKNAAAQLQLNLNPGVIHADFEMAVIGAVSAEFGIETSGCLFHFCQSILRHVAANGLQTAYNGNNPPEVRTTVRRLMSMPLVPPIRIDQAFNAIANQAPSIPGMDILVNYVRDTYIDVQGALFDRAVWNCYGMVDRTTNSCEAYHRVVNAEFHHHSPDPYKFVEFLQRQEMEFERRQAQLLLGAAPKKRRPTYVMVDEALTRLRGTYFGGGIPSIARVITYMDAVGHQLYDVKH